MVSTKCGATEECIYMGNQGEGRMRRRETGGPRGGGLGTWVYLHSIDDSTSVKVDVYLVPG